MQPTHPCVCCQHSRTFPNNIICTYAKHSMYNTIICFPEWKCIMYAHSIPLPCAMPNNNKHHFSSFPANLFSIHSLYRLCWCVDVIIQCLNLWLSSRISSPIKWEMRDFDPMIIAFWHTDIDFSYIRISYTLEGKIKASANPIFARHIAMHNSLRACLRCECLDVSQTDKNRFAVSAWGLIWLAICIDPNVLRHSAKQQKWNQSSTYLLLQFEHFLSSAGAAFSENFVLVHTEAHRPSAIMEYCLLIKPRILSGIWDAHLLLIIFVWTASLNSKYRRHWQ